MTNAYTRRAARASLSPFCLSSRSDPADSSVWPAPQALCFQRPRRPDPPGWNALLVSNPTWGANPFRLVNDFRTPSASLSLFSLAGRRLGGQVAVRAQQRRGRLLLGDDVVAQQHRTGLVARDLQGRGHVHAGPQQRPDGRAPRVVEQPVLGQTSGLQGRAPDLPEVPLLVSRPAIAGLLPCGEGRRWINGARIRGRPTGCVAHAEAGL